MHKCHELLLPILLLGAAGCASFGTLKDTHAHILGFGENQEVSDEDMQYRAQYNSKILSLYHGERPYRSGGSLPNRCLALSGGGVRSAMYGIGVMKALSEHTSLDNLDLISAVSGGAYAAGWYFQNLRQFDGRSALLFDEGELSKLTDKGSLGHRITMGIFRGTLVATMPALVVGLSLYDNLTLGVINPPGHANLSYLYNTLLLSPYEAQGVQTTEDTGRYLRANNLPAFILNLTIQDRYSSDYSKGQIFEVSTWGIGSDYNRYITYQEARDNAYLDDYAKWRFSDVVAISGAALSKPWQGCITHSLFDTCPWKKSWAYVRMYTGLTLGYTMWSFDKSHWDNHSFGDYFFLSDGGHTENLGAYSLIRRHCNDLTVVDAGYDENYEFDDYIVLRSLVKNRLWGTLQVKDIDDHLKTHERGACPSPIWNAPVTKGKVEGLPVVDNGIVNKDPITVTYLKLSIDRGSLKDLSPQSIGHKQCVKVGPEGPISAEPYYSSRLVSLAKNDGNFPMYTTQDQWLSVEQRNALMDLGYAQMKSVLCGNGLIVP